MMILNEKEVLSCLVYMSDIILGNKMKIIEADLLIDKKMIVSGKVIYDNQPLNISVSFLLDYKNEQICIYDIDSNIEYLIFKLNFMNLLKHALKDCSVVFGDRSLNYSIKLPISQISLLHHNIEVKIK